MAYIITSPLKGWEGTVSLPDPDEFSRTHWDTWKNAVNKPKRKPYALIHLYCYAGLELVQRFGEWNMSVPLPEVRAWEESPDDERVKLVAWLGRELRQYMDDIIDPKG